MARTSLAATPAAVEPAAPAGATAPAPVGDGPRTEARILVVEDNAVNQKLALLLLSKLSYNADIAANGREAIIALERQPYDLVFMDLHMPVLDGLSATREICERWPAAQLTGLDSSASMLEGST